jgi:hypothetical protein
MNKFMFALLLLCGAQAAAQKVLPKFGQVNQSEFSTTCSYESDPDALVLFDKGEYFCNIVYNSINPVRMQTERHVRIKILKDKGLNQADVHIKYYSYGGEEIVTDIAGNTYNLDVNGQVWTTKMEKKNIFTKMLNKRYSEISFSLPAVKAGCIIEYKYVIEGPFSKNWYFQKSIPVLYSTYKVNFPPEIEMSVVPHCSLPYQSKNEFEGGRTVQNYSMENVPSLKDEAYISSEYDYLQSITPRMIAINPRGGLRRSLVRTWPGIIKQLMEDDDFGVQLKKNIPRIAELDSLLAKETVAYRRMKIIYEYVKNNMEWDGKDNIWALNGVKSAWKDKKGTSGEINLILINLLRDAGLKAHPVLVSTRTNGAVNTFYPSFGQFDKVMAYVEMSEKNYVLDAVNKFGNCNYIPEDVVASQGLVIEKLETYEWGWRALWDKEQLFTQQVIINASVDSASLQLQGNAAIHSSGFARTSRLPMLKKDRKKFIEDFIIAGNAEIKIDTLVVENETSDSLPLIQNVNFSERLNGTGDYTYFSANLFAGLNKNPFIPDNRFSDVFFGYQQKIIISGTFMLPEGYVFEEVPKNLKMIMPDSSIIFSRLSNVDDYILSMRFTIEFTKPIYSVDSYAEFREFYQRLFELLNEQYVFRRKSK